MANKSKEDHLKTRSKILESALHLFSEKGLERVTFVEIGKKSGFTRGAVHSHFKDKYEIMNELIEKYSIQEESFVKEILDLEKDFFKILKKVSYLNFELLLQSPHRMSLEKILLFDKYSNSKTMNNQLKKKRESDLKFLEFLFNSFFKANQQKSLMSSKDHSVALYSFILGLEVSWLENSSHLEMEQNYKKYIDQYFNQYT